MVGSLLLDTATDYGRAGLRVFPCHSVAGGQCSCGCRDAGCKTRGKHPRIREWQRVATTDLAIIREWWSRWPRSNIGAAMEPSGMIAADIDPRNGGDESWQALCSEIGIEATPPTWTNLTGGGGVHFLYRAPAGLVCRTDSLAPGVDVKWHGYVILPPSSHVSGTEYTWEIGYAPGEIPLLALPDALVGILSARPASEDVPPGTGDGTEVRDLLTRTCPEGQRHTTLLRLLGWARNTMTEDEAASVLLAWDAQYCRPPLGAAHILPRITDAWERWAEPASAFIEDDEEEQAAAGGPFEIIDAVDFKRRPAPKWDIDGIIQEHTFVCVLGEPGSGKTFWALEMAMCKAYGVPFFGRQVRRSSVLYVCSEGAGGFGLRIAAWEKARDVEMERGWMHVLPGVVGVTDEKRVRALIQQVLAFGQPFGMVVLDTLSRNMAGADENSSEDMTKAVEMAGLIQKLLGCIVVVLHHGRKSDGGIRGHSSLPGALDTIITIAQDRAAKTISAECTKQKDGDDFEPMLYRPVVVDLEDELPDDEGDDIMIGATPKTSLVLEEIDGEEKRQKQAERRASRLSDTQRLFARDLYEAFRMAGVTTEEWMSTARNAGWNGPRQTFHAARAALVKKGLIRVEQHGAVDRNFVTSDLAVIISLWKASG